jgi:hypothetical protein
VSCADVGSREVLLGSQRSEEQVTIRQVGEVVFCDARLLVALLVICGLVDVRSSGQPLSMSGGVSE